MSNPIKEITQSPSATRAGSSVRSASVRQGEPLALPRAIGDLWLTVLQHIDGSQAAAPINKSASESLKQFVQLRRQLPDSALSVSVIGRGDRIRCELLCALHSLMVEERRKTGIAFLAKALDVNGEPLVNGEEAAVFSHLCKQHRVTDQDLRVQGTMGKQAPVRVEAVEREGVATIIRHIAPDPDPQTAFDQRFARLLNPMLVVRPSADAESVARQLEKEFPWMQDAIVSVVRRLMVLPLRKNKSGPVFSPMLLHGLHGSGKTRFARRLGELLGVPTLFVPVGGNQSNMLLAGASRGYNGSRPNVIAEFMLEHPVANPIVILDEIDKIDETRANGNPADVLLQWLDPNNSSIYLDGALLGEMDLSRVSFIATANNPDAVQLPLRQRFGSKHLVPAPTADNLVALAPDIWESIAGEYEIDPRFIPLTNEHVDRALKASGSIRRFVQALTALYEAELAAMQFVRH